MFTESEAYDRFMGRWSRKLAVAFLDFVKLGDQDRVLEIGSGTGSLSRAILERISGGSVTGIDPSPHFVEHVRATVSDDRATFHLGSADHIEQPDDYFDATLSMLVLNFVPDAPAAAREMARVTRSGGVVAAAVWDYVGEMQMLRFFWEEAARLDPELQRDDGRHQRLSGEGDLAQLWRDVGFIDIESAPLQIEMRFDSFDDYWQPFLGGQGPAGAYVASLSDSARSSLADNLRVRLQSAHGEVRLTARSWAVKGLRRELDSWRLTPELCIVTQANRPIGEFGAVRHAAGGLYAMVDGHVKWLRPTAFRLPEHGCGCVESMVWKDVDDAIAHAPKTVLTKLSESKRRQ